VTYPVTARPLPEQPTVVVLRALPGLGDWLCAIPTLQALRRARPGARIHVVGLESTRDLLGRYTDLIDVFHPFPGWPGLPERRPDVQAIPGFLSALHALDADLAIQLHGSGNHTNDIVELFGARAVAGFYRPGERCPDPARFLRWHEDDPEVRRGLRLLGLLGLAADDDSLRFPLDPGARARTTQLLADAGVTSPYVVLHPGSNRVAARWAPDRFIEVAASLASAGRRIVLTGGSAERGLTGHLAARIPDAADLGGRTDLDTLGWLLRGSDLLISNDTGVSHLAAALRVRSVVVFPDGSEAHRRRWAPIDGERHRAVPPSVPRVVAEASRQLRSLEHVS
jgi:ADP-heptose:LPS heptosyltransferase